MSELSRTRENQVRRLIEQVPDGAIGTLENALAHGGRDDASIAAIQTMVSAELLERRTTAAVFAPLAPLFAPPRDAMPRLTFPPSTPRLAWRALQVASPGELAQALRAYATLRPDDETPPIFDALCRRIADGLRAGSEPFAPLRQALLEWRGSGVARLIECLALAPLARRAVRRLPDWVRILSTENAAALRLAFRDAAAFGDSAGPTFMEILFAHLDDPSQVLRLISLVMDKPSDRYLAASELAAFGDRLLDDIDRRIGEVRRFDIQRGLAGGVALAASIQVATLVIHEFEQWLSLNREGPWGSRLIAQKRLLALAVESRLREVEEAVAHALPTLAAGYGPRARRGAPRLTADPDAAAVNRALALLGLLNETRSAAAYGGFAALRAKAIDALCGRIDPYAEDLIDLLHTGEGPPARVRAYLEVAAVFMGLVRDPKAAEIVRRRTAVA